MKKVYILMSECAYWEDYAIVMDVYSSLDKAVKELHKWEAKDNLRRFWIDTRKVK